MFSVKRDGSYHEVPAIRESFSQNDGAFLLIDRIEKKIYIYRKAGISSALSYSAARAATNFNTRKGSRYKVINIEPEDKDRMLTEIIDKIDAGGTVHATTTVQTPVLNSNYVYGEKFVSIQPGESSVYVPEVSTLPEKIQTKERISAKDVIDSIRAYDVEEIVKTLASKMLFETNIESIKSMKKPPRHQLRSELIKKIDTLLDSIY